MTNLKSYSNFKKEILKRPLCCLHSRIDLTKCDKGYL